ncbi:MAG: transglutaminase-like domain-containing protein [Lysobacteraceae bacterium]
MSVHVPPRRLAGLAVLVLLLAAAATLRAAEAEPSETWFSVHLEGRKIGHLHQTRSQAGEEIVHEETLRLELARDGQTLRIGSTERTVESIDGRPLAFRSHTDTAGSVGLIEGEIRDGVAMVTIDHSGRRLSQRIDWPADALFGDAQARRDQRHGLTAGTRYRHADFDLGGLRMLAVDVEVIGPQSVDIHGSERALIAVDRRFDAGDGQPMRIRSWVDPADRSVQRMQLMLLGMSLDLMACERACAQAPNQSADVLVATSTPSPRRLSQRDRQRPLRYRLAMRDGDLPRLPALPGQSVQAQGEWLELRIDPRGGIDRLPKPEDTAATRWLESDAAELRELARRLIDDAVSAEERMRALESGVRRHLAVKSLRIGYASALDAARLGEGDCTEHALLLAALARAEGIPARVATGLAYASAYAGQQQVFVPHAWVYAFIDGRWQGFDAALPAFGAGHLALNVGDGDPFRFYAGVELLGRLRIDGIRAAR